MSLTKIKSALVDAFQTGGFSLPTAYENRNYEPKPGTPWAELFVIPNQPEVATLGDAGEDSHTGIFQINLNYPPNQGEGPILATADAVRAVFSAGKRLTNNGQTMTVLSCGRSRGIQAGGWYRISITITWYALTAR